MNKEPKLTYLEKWVIANIDENVVPRDEGNGPALVYNIIHLLRKDGQTYDYKPEQDAEIRSWGFTDYEA